MSTRTLILTLVLALQLVLQPLAAAAHGRAVSFGKQPCCCDLPSTPEPELESCCSTAPSEQAPADREGDCGCLVLPDRGPVAPGDAALGVEAQRPLQERCAALVGSAIEPPLSALRPARAAFAVPRARPPLRLLQQVFRL